MIGEECDNDFNGFHVIEGKIGGGDYLTFEYSKEEEIRMSKP